MSAEQRTGGSPDIAELVRSRRVIVCCGAGGVGKTTVSASLAVGAARAGLRVVAITVDPSRRLAEALGVARNLTAPSELPRERLRAVGVEPPGTLAVWMLDPQMVCDGVVQAVAGGDGARRQLLGNRIYSNLSKLIAGMHEYTAIEALHGFIRDDRYQLVVLDTPPSRDALRFLEAPSRANAFLDARMFGYFLPAQGTALRWVGSRVMNAILDLGVGREAREELQQFLSLFNVVLQQLSRNQEAMRRFFRSPAVSFLLVTSPTQVAIEEAAHFEARARALGLPVGGYVLNQSLAGSGEPLPRPAPPSGGAAPALRAALDKLAALGDLEERTALAHAGLAAALRARLGPLAPLTVLPRLTRRHTDLQALAALADLLMPEPPTADVTTAGLQAAAG
jgi:anion-transporting  ArsA/GET3 family ATPase